MMQDESTSQQTRQIGEGGSRWSLARVLIAQGFTSHGANLMMLGIFFYMHHVYQWNSRQNLLLSCAQGVVYVTGALLANKLSSAWGRRGLLKRLQVGMVVLAIGLFYVRGAGIVTAGLLAYTLLCATQWPAMESLVSSGASAKELSKRIAIYNLMWSGVGAVTLALVGTILAHDPSWMFLLAAAAHAMTGVMLLGGEKDPPPTHAQATPDPELLPMRTLAMQLSRVALPATYAVSYSLNALMPTLPLIKALPQARQTVVASLWMVGRWLAFVFLGVTTWWHVRPRAMLAWAVVLLGSFLMVTLWGNWPAMIVGQLLLGVAMGWIYSGSLYFGMVLSDGSTEHGGYHEALIGLGSILGPGIGAAAEFLGNGTQTVGIKAVAGLIFISVLAAAAVSLQSRRKAG